MKKPAVNKIKLANKKWKHEQARRKKSKKLFKQNLAAKARVNSNYKRIKAIATND